MKKNWYLRHFYFIPIEYQKGWFLMEPAILVLFCGKRLHDKLSKKTQQPMQYIF